MCGCAALKDIKLGLIELFERAQRTTFNILYTLVGVEQCAQIGLIQKFQKNEDATCPDRAPDMTDVRDTKRHLVDCGHLIIFVVLILYE